MKSETTLYNHVALGSASKPLIKNIQLKQASERIQKGEIDVYEKVLHHFTLEKGQRNLLDTIYNNQIKNNE